VSISCFVCFQLSFVRSLRRVSTRRQRRAISVRNATSARKLVGDLEFARAGFATYEGEAQEVEGLRFAEPAPFAAFRRKASELDEPGLLGMQRQRKPSQPLTHLFQKEPCVDMVLEADDEVIGIAHDNHVAGG